ncbi:MAG: M23 family metallopeptidase [Thermostichus sp. HHBFW_bins_43]
MLKPVMDPLLAALRLFFPQSRQLRRLSFGLGLGLGLLWLYPTTLLAQPQPNRLPPPPVVEPALDTPGAAALLLDGSIPMPDSNLETTTSTLEPNEPLTLEAETRTETVVGREIVLEPEETRDLATPPDSDNPIVVPVVLMERASGRRIIISPGQEIRIEDPNQPQDPEPETPALPELASGDERLLYPLPHPVPITSGFGMRIHPIRGQPEFHAGVDLGASMGTPILASFSGKVVASGSLGGLGIAVVLEHAGQQRTRYGHMSKVAVAAGDVVEQGSVIGYVGASGEVTGPHLHFELWKRAAGQDWVVLDATNDLKIAVAQLPG